MFYPLLVKMSYRKFLEKKNIPFGKKIVCIMPVWEEQNMIGLAIASTKSVVYEYIVFIKPGIDATKEVVEYVKNLWNLNIRIIETTDKLRDCRRKAIEMTNDYADYYLLQDGDEIYYSHTDSERNIESLQNLIKEGYTFCFTCMIFLEKDLCHTPNSDSQTWLVEHPFFFQNLPDIYFPDVGDMPHYNPNFLYHKVFHTGNEQKPFKFDAKIKNFRRCFLREVFTLWHDTCKDMTIEEYADIHHLTVKWYRENVDKNLTLEEIIKRFEEHETQSEEQFFKWHKIFDENKFAPYPYVIRKSIELNYKRGIEKLEDLHYLAELA